MAANVKALLDSLHECLNIGAVEALPVVLDLQSSVGGCSDHGLVIGIAHLLDPTKGVLIFLERSCHFPGKEWPKVCAELLALLKELVKNKLSLDKHIFVIIDGCMSLFNKIETKANIVLVTNLIQDCLKKLHEQGGGSDKTMDISDLIYKSLSNKTRSSITVIDAICGLVQTLLETSPSMFDNERVTKWLGFFMHSLKTEMITKGQKKKPPDLQLIAGSFNGINGVLSAFSEVVSQTTVGEIFRLLVLCCNPNVEAKRHAMQTSVLTLLAGHTPKFKEFLFKDNIKLLDFLVKMLSNVKNAGLRSSICKALSALVLEMSKEMMANEEEGPTLFHHYLSVLVPLLTSPHRRQISAVMQCLGHLARPCKVILGEEKLLQLFKKILVAGESVCVGSGSEADYSSLLPSVISALADTVNCIQTISPDIRHHLAAPLVSLVEVFPELHVKLQGGCYHSIQALLAAVHSDRDAFLWLLNELTYQGLLRCSSNSEPAEYSSLWCDLLTKYTYLVTETDVKRDVHMSLLDALINSFLVIFEKLDLKVAEQDTMEDTDEDRMIVDDPPNKDLDLLGNLSSLLTHVISTVGDDRLEKWVVFLVKSTVEASDKVPDAQCCYWLLKSVVCYCDTSDYFSSPYHLAEVGSILRQFGYTVIERLDRLVEDTRIASISLLLSYPVALIRGSVEMFALAVKEALSRGIGCTELGRRGVESVWRVVRAGESGILSDHYPDILPLFNPYLTSKADTTDKSEVSLYELQCDIVLLLGTLGGRVNSLLITPQLPDICWSNETVLTVAIPLGPALHNICLDEMLREVMTLCKTTSEGQARTCACELLHALFLVSIATEQQAPDKIKVLYDHTLPVLLELGCDSNSVVRQIFKELTFQMIHWQTSRSKDSFILHHIMSGIQQSGNIELREFCGECIGEFFKWSIKHSSDVMSPAVRNVFKQLIYCAEHPATTKQLAAATAFNAFYRTFREEDVLVSDYTMILISLLLDSYNTKYSSSLHLSLTHLTRIVTSKHLLFIESTKTRFVPRFGEEGTLFELTKHSFSLTFSPKAHVREIARTIYLKIYHLIPGCSSHHQLLDKFGSDTLPTINDSLTPNVLTGVLSWVGWLSDNSIVANTQKLIESLGLTKHTQTILSTPNLQISHPSLLLYVSLLPSLQTLLSRDVVCDMVLNPGPLLAEQQYCVVVARFLNRLDKSRDQEIVGALTDRIRNLSETGALLELSTIVLQNISQLYSRKLLTDLETSLNNLPVLPLSECLLHKARYSALVNLHLLSISDLRKALDAIEKLRNGNQCLFNTIKNDIRLSLTNCEVLVKVLKTGDPMEILIRTADLLSFVSTESKSKLGEELIKTLLSNWEVFDTSSLMSSDHKIKLVEVVSLMSGVVEKTLLSETQFLRTIYTLLLDKTCSNKHKIDLINVMKGLKLETASLNPVLEEFRTGHLPLLSTQFTPGSMEHRDYVSLVNCLCDAASATAATPLISVVTKVVCSEDLHPCNAAYQAMICHIATRLSSHNYSQTTEHLLQVVLLKGRVCRKGMIPLLKKVNKVVLIRFTEEHWTDFSKHLDVNAACGYTVTESVCDMLQVFLTRTVPSDTTTDISKDIIRISAKVREVSKFGVGEDKLAGWYSRNQSLYSLLASALLHCDKEYKFFDGLVLSEKGNKKVWSNVFPDTLPAVLALEKSYGKQRESQATGEDSSSESAGSFTLLFESSLSQDVTQYSQNPALAKTPVQESSTTTPETSQSSNSSDPLYCSLGRVFHKFVDKQAFLQRFSGILTDVMIENNVKVLLSRVLLSTGDTLLPHLGSISEVWVGWLVSRGVVDNLTEEVLQLCFNHQIIINDRMTCSDLLVLLLTQCTADAAISNDLIGLSSHLLSVWSCSPVDISVFSSHLLPTNSTVSKNACRSLKLLLDSSCVLMCGDKLFDPLIQLLKVPQKKVYGPAAVVLGLLLSWVKRNCAQLYQESVNLFNDLCLALFRDQVQLLKFISVVHAVSKGHSETATRFQGQLMDNLSRIYGKPKSLVIETLSMSGEERSVVVALEKSGLEKLMRDTDIQITVANALIKSADSISSDQMLSILEDMKKIIGTSGEECKKLLLRFTVKCYEKSTNANITDNCISILIRAVCDKDLRQIAVEFWNSTLPTTVKDRFEKLVSLYSFEVDDVFLRSVAIILLSLGELSSSYQSPLYLKPLATDLSWQDQDISGTFNFEQKQRGKIRATQKVFQFSQTQADQFSRGHNTKSVVQTPRGFLSRGSSGSQRTLSYSELTTARMRAERRQQSQQARSKAIHLVRNYRAGELPDIQITYQDLIRPMGAIANISEKFASFTLQALLEDEDKLDLQDDILLILRTTSNQGLAKFCIELCVKQSYVADDAAALAIRHHQYSLGVLWTEEAITKCGKDERGWGELCSIYGAIGDHDAILGIRKHEMSTEPGLLEAITAMSLKNFSLAEHKFKDLGGPPQNDMLDCMLNLCQWNELDDHVEDLPPSSFSARIQLSSMSHAIETFSLAELENIATKFEGHLQVDTHGILALLLHLKENDDKALAQIYKGVQSFLAEWRVSQQNVQKKNALHPCQALAELYDLVHKGSQLASHWSSCYPEDISTPFTIWQGLLNQRGLLPGNTSDEMENSCSYTESDSLMEDRTGGDNKYGLIFAAVQSALKQNSASIAKRLVQQIDVNELYGEDLINYYGIGTEVVIRSVEEANSTVSENISRLEGMLGMLDEEQFVSSARLKLKMAQLLFKNQSVSRHEPGALYAEGMETLTRIDCSTFNENSVKNYDVVIEMLSSEIQKPTLALIDSQESDIKLVFQNVTLTAMRYNSRKARLMFPYVLQSICGEQAKSDFLKKCSEIPSWMFIEWLSQLLAFVPTPLGNAAVQVLKIIALDYPHALSYSWRVSLEDWKDIQGEVSSVVSEISGLVTSEDLNPFLEALATLTPPVMLLKDLIEEMAVKANKGSQNSYLDKITEQLFCKNSLSDIRNSFAAKHKHSWSTLVNKLNKVDVKKKVEELKKYQQKIGMDGGKQPGNKKKGPKLSDYSKWFTKYQAGSLELPGQYSGIDKPNPSYHKKIAKFEETVTVLDSLRKPVKINILLDSGEKRSVLVKGGEDLRTDQRVMQLLKVMDDKLRTTLKDASLRTYDVIPLTNNLGMIAWLPNTKTIKSVLFDDTDKHVADKVRAQYIAWVDRFGSKTDNTPACYKKMYQRCSLDDVVLQSKRLSGQISPTKLKSVLVNLARSPDSFVLLRKKFVSTYVSMCLCHWILGVGDRHLSNFLLDTTTGELIGIDFGHVFGTATTLLPIPELLPFRATPQFTGVFAPLGVEAAIRGPMTRALTSLREIRSVLFCLMDVFVREPTLDWCKYSNKHSTKQGQASEDSWYPKAKVETARKKLELGNPSEILRDELKENVHVGKEQAFSHVALGTRKLHARAKVGAVCASVDEQVMCLIELASDLNVLGRQYSGLETWL